ncbi:TPA: hypothetical protein DCG86_09005 [Candidatus Marinimicrobia bacterium]|nr:MAG: Uncharacterized protein XD77_1404 [Marinimicrobia bacterium 46_47]KUK89816.1 MAG: hypothetical protein XE04_1679 [Marinimicrobia bacterium 46_43]HAE88144.1 hypothetical protein [Candidatus Neomarinimicrobiota bacterium]HBY18039.1 hypothetical protein [Candidatus Neomarinimicrobiota bacterium]
MVHTFQLSTSRSLCFTDITSKVRQVIRDSGCRNGIAVVFTPHTTAGITINENADPHVLDDLIWKFRDLVPPDDPEYLHAEGNSHSHVLSTLTGASETLIIQEGKLLLGMWQGLYFCEFDGPRTRTIHIKIVPDRE